MTLQVETVGEIEMTEDLRDIEPLIWKWPKRSSKNSYTAQPALATTSENELETVVREALQNAVDYAGKEHGEKCVVDFCYLRKAGAKKEQEIFELIDSVLFKTQSKRKDTTTGYLLIRDYGTGISKQWSSFERICHALHHEREPEEKYGKLGGRGIGRTAYLNLSSKSAYTMISWPESEGDCSPFIFGQAFNDAAPGIRDAIEFVARKEPYDGIDDCEATQKTWVDENIYSADSIVKKCQAIADGSDCEMFSDSAGCMVVIPIKREARQWSLIKLLKDYCIKNFGVRVLQYKLDIRLYEGLDLKVKIDDETIKEEETIGFIKDNSEGKTNVCKYYLDGSDDKRFEFSDGVKKRLQGAKKNRGGFSLSINVVLQRISGQEERVLGQLKVYYGTEATEAKHSYVLWRLGMHIIGTGKSLRRPVALCIDDLGMSRIVNDLESSTHSALSVKDLKDGRLTNLRQFIEGRFDDKGFKVSDEETKDLLKPLIKLIRELPRNIDRELAPPVDRLTSAEGFIPGGGPPPPPGTKKAKITFSRERQGNQVVLRAYLKRREKICKGDVFTFALSIGTDGGDVVETAETNRIKEVRSTVEWLVLLVSNYRSNSTLDFQCTSDDYAKSEWDGGEIANFVIESRHMISIDVVPEVVRREALLAAN